MKNNKKIKLLFLVLFLLFLNPSFVFALEINYPRVPGAAPPQDFIGSAPSEQIIPLYVFYIFNLIIWLSGIIAFGVVVYAGIRYLTSAGRTEVILSARNQISSAFLGILLLLSSFLILRVINTQLVVLTIPKPEPVELVEKPKVGSPPTEAYRSSINVELPLAEVIKNVFGISSYVTLSSSSSLERIKELSASTTAVAEELEDNADDLKKKLYWCGCWAADPDCTGCSTYCTDDCTCDVCDWVRDDINDIEEDNLQKFDELKPLQEKIEEEIRLLRAKIAKVERLQKFMLDCRLAILNSRAENLDTQNFYMSNAWPLWNIKFWDFLHPEGESQDWWQNWSSWLNLGSSQNWSSWQNWGFSSAKDADLVSLDWRNFYCPVSGTIWGGYESEEIPIQDIIQELEIIDVPQGTEEAMACKQEIPVGEILDRAIRISNTLAQKMQYLNNLSKDMVDEVNELHTEISRCSSQQPMCCSFCIRIKGVCIRLCIGIGCPWNDIKHQLERIEDIRDLIRQTVYGQDGIFFIIDNVIPKLLEDLDNYLYLSKPLKECITETSPEAAEELPPIILADCESALRAIGPERRVIENCCLDEPEFQKCLDQCHLKEGQEQYKDCLRDCLKSESETLRNQNKIRESEIIATCMHKMNFYCCGK